MATCAKRGYCVVYCEYCGDLACLCCKNANRFRNGEGTSIPQPRGGWADTDPIRIQGCRLDWEVTRAVTVWVLIETSKRLMEFLWGKFGYKSRALSWRHDRVPLSPLDVVPLGHAKWHSVLVIIFIAATSPVVVGSAPRARWTSTMPPSMAVQHATRVARNSRSPGRQVSFLSCSSLVQLN